MNNQNDSSLPVLVVCGFGRCGSSLMMQMLNAGGISTSGRYPAFEDECANLAAFDIARLAEMRGRAVKVLDPHEAPSMDHIPHAAIWIDRNPKQQAKSFAKFSATVLGFHVDRGMRVACENSYRRERPGAMRAASADPSNLFRTTFEILIKSPGAAMTVLAEWLQPFGFRLDADRAATAALHRGTECLSYMLEFEQMRDAKLGNGNGG